MRIAEGISQRCICQELGISIKTYHNWIKGDTAIPSFALIKLANKFNVSIDYLLEIKKRAL
mgnify:CR=1 FL=1